MVKERPILFNGEMVRAILDGRKTQTRRPIKPQPYKDKDPYPDGRDIWHYRGKHMSSGFTVPQWVVADSPFGAPGDRLYGRETWRVIGWHEGMPLLIQYKSDGTSLEEPGDSTYWDEDRYMQYYFDCTDDCLAAGFTANEEGVFNMPDDEIPTRWRPSIHMPRWASRITLEVKRVWVEQVHEISEEDAIAEGCELAEGYEHLAVAFFQHPHKQVFIELWDDIYAKRGFGWDANPWVWVIDFKPVR